MRTFEGEDGGGQWQGTTENRKINIHQQQGACSLTLTYRQHTGWLLRLFQRDNLGLDTYDSRIRIALPLFSSF